MQNFNTLTERCMIWNCIHILHFYFILYSHEILGKKGGFYYILDLLALGLRFRIQNEA